MASSRIGFVWVYGIIVMFATGVIELVIMPAVQFKLAPALIQSANITLSASDVTDFTNHINSTIGFMHSAIYVVMFVIFVYLVLSIFKREDNEFYQP